jgi:hypothetical protein
LTAKTSLQTARHKPKTAPKSKVKAKKDKLPTVKKMRAKCDKLLTPIIKKLYPYCLLTGAPTEVAHHHVHKSASNALRYYIPNLIPLTNSAHLALHINESYWASKIVQIKGLKWFEDLEREKNKTIKCDIHWYIENYNRLKEILDSLN